MSSLRLWSLCFTWLGHQRSWLSISPLGRPVGSVFFRTVLWPCRCVAVSRWFLVFGFWFVSQDYSWGSPAAFPLLRVGSLLKTDSGYPRDAENTLRVEFLLKTDIGYPFILWFWWECCFAFLTRRRRVRKISAWRGSAFSSCARVCWLMCCVNASIVLA